MNQDHAYTPALGRRELTGLYDAAIRLLTRESTWRSALLAQVAPSPNETIIDIGCGTGSFAILLKTAAPQARIIGMDPDPDVLARAAEKARRAEVEIEWRRGLAHDVADFRETLDKAVSSLVFHQVPAAGKRAGIAAMFGAVRAGGSIHIADYALQIRPLMRLLFRLTVQQIDGVADTQPNADGALEAILADVAGADAAKARQVVRTPTGAISLFKAVK